VKTITITKNDKIIKGTIQLPFSKSISNRLMIIRAQTAGGVKINNLAEADDTLLLANLLKQISERKPKQPIVELDTGNAGTAMRFLTAYLCSVPGRWILTGSDRMKMRPIGPLVDALRLLGAEIDYLSKLGYPPLLIKGTSLRGGEITIDAGVSSQFVSALIMIGPCIPGGITLFLKGEAVSKPYINMTIRLLEYFGIKVKRDKNKISINESAFIPRDFSVEADWSSASFWYESAALADEADLILMGLHSGSIQGDSVLSELYENLGVATEYIEDGVRITHSGKKTAGFYFNFSDYPDIAPPVIMTCAAIGIRGRFEGLKSLKIKESDRLLALANEFKKMGIIVEEGDRSANDLSLEFPPSRIKTITPLRMASYGDHRMAMTFAPLALKLGTITIESPDVVKKSYPQFWEHLASLGFEVTI
jgi:3-phosphoshikimate 1-carboxyvinyltransferase